jgi:hypothetical protein
VRPILADIPADDEPLQGEEAVSAEKPLLLRIETERDEPFLALETFFRLQQKLPLPHLGRSPERLLLDELELLFDDGEIGDDEVGGPSSRSAAGSTFPPGAAPARIEIPKDERERVRLAKVRKRSSARSPDRSAARERPPNRRTILGVRRLLRVVERRAARAAGRGP